MYKTASCAEIAGNYLHHWINVTCVKVVKNGPNLKKLAQKISNWRMWWRKKKKILAQTLCLVVTGSSVLTFIVLPVNRNVIIDICMGEIRKSEINVTRNIIIGIYKERSEINITV